VKLYFITKAVTAACNAAHGESCVTMLHAHGVHLFVQLHMGPVRVHFYVPDRPVRMYHRSLVRLAKFSHPVQNVLARSSSLEHHFFNNMYDLPMPVCRTLGLAS